MGTPTNSLTELLEARWEEIRTNPDDADVDFIVDVIFHKWEILSKMLPNGADNSKKGSHFYTVQDIAWYRGEYKTYQDRCRAALLDWVEGHHRHDHKQFLQTLRDAGLGSHVDKILSGLLPKSSDDGSNDDAGSVRSQQQATPGQILPCISDHTIRLLPSHPMSESQVLGTDVTAAMWQGALVAVKQFGRGSGRGMKRGEAAAKELHRRQEEFRIHASLRHPHILPLYGMRISITGAPMGLVSEAMDTTLYERCRSKSKLACADLVPILINIVSALVYVEDRGFIHANLCTKNVFLSRTSSGQCMAKIGGSFVVQESHMSRRSSAPMVRRGAVRKPGQVERHSQSSKFAAIDNIHDVGLLIMEALLEGEQSRKSPREWVADLCHQGYDARFTHLVSKCLEKTGHRQMTCMDLLDRLESIDQSLIDPYDDTVSTQISLSNLEQDSFSITRQPKSSTSVVYMADISLKALQEEKRELQAQVENLTNKLKAFKMDGRDSVISWDDDLDSDEGTDEDMEEEVNSRTAILGPEQEPFSFDKASPTEPDVDVETTSSGFDYDVCPCDSQTASGVLGGFQAAFPTCPIDIHMLTLDLKPAMIAMTPSPRPRRRSSVSQASGAVEPPPQPDTAPKRPTMLVDQSEDNDAVFVRRQAVCSGDSTPPSQASSAVGTPSDVSREGDMVAANPPNKSLWKKIKVRVSVGRAKPRPSRSSQEKSPSPLQETTPAMHFSSSTQAPESQSSLDHDEVDRPQPTLPQPTAPQLTRPQPSTLTLSTPTPVASPLVSPAVPGSSPLIARHTPCFARCSHLPMDDDDLPLMCGEPLVVWQNDDSGRVFYARSIATGMTGTVSPGNVVPLKRIRRRLYVFNFQNMPQDEVSRIKASLARKLPKDNVEDFCNVLLKQMKTESAYDSIRETCRNAGDLGRCMFSEMFKHWSRTNSANGLSYFEAAKTVSEEYQRHVLQALQVLIDP